MLPERLLSNFFGNDIYYCQFHFLQYQFFLILFKDLQHGTNRSVKRETLKLIETFVDKAEDQPHIGKQFVPPMMDPVLGDYARNLPDARESEVLSLFATIINKYGRAASNSLYCMKNKALFSNNLFDSIGIFVLSRCKFTNIFFLITCLQYVCFKWSIIFNLIIAGINVL